MRPTFRSTSYIALGEVDGNNIYRRRIVFTSGVQLKDMLGNMSIEKYTLVEIATVKDPDDGGEAVDPRLRRKSVKKVGNEDTPKHLSLPTLSRYTKTAVPNHYSNFRHHEPRP